METIYEKLGDVRLEKLVRGFYEYVFSNEKIKHLFQNDKEVIIAKQKAFLTQFLGGRPLYNETYGPPKMRMRHMPHEITQEAAEEWLRCMGLAIDDLEGLEKEFKVALFNCFPKLAQHMVNR